MRLPLSWLQERYPHQLPLETLSDTLTMAIAEVDAIEETEGEPVLVLTQKPDRGDVLCVEGLAREVAALTGDRFSEPPRVEGDRAALPSGEVLRLTTGREEASTLGFPVSIEAPDLCVRYVACLVDDVKVGPSPEWLQRRIRQMGQRPVNNVVDATQFVMFEMGQPFHAFDRDRLRGPAIRVRRARKGEPLQAINGETYALTGDELVIADAEIPVVIAGVMGGLESEVGEGSTRLLLESACFEAVSIRLTSRALGLKSESSFRFERNVDPEGCLRGMVRLIGLITELAGGRVAGEILDVYPAPRHPRQVRFRPARARKLLGMSISDDTMIDCFTRLGLDVQSIDGTLLVTVPTRRPDLEIEEDLIEEVIRVVGYDAIPTTLPVGDTTPGQVLPERKVEDRVRDALVGAGYTEVRSYSLTSIEMLEHTGEAGPATSLRNPMTADRAVLRPSLLPSVLETAETNLARGVRQQHLFEIGRVFRPRADNPAPLESTHIAGIAMGSAWTSSWNRPSDLVVSDFYAVRGALEDLASALRLRIDVHPAGHNPFLHPGRAGRVVLPDGVEVGFLGELHPAIVERLGLLHRPIVFELMFGPLFAAHTEAANREIETEVSRQPPMHRDIAVVVSRAILAGDVVAAIKNASPLIAEARLFDVYQGPGIGDDEQSLAIALVLREPGRTLTDAEANTALDQVLGTLSERFGARRR